MSSQTTSNNRGRAVAGALAGALVLVVLAVVFFVVRSGDDDEPRAAASTAAAAAAPSAAEQPPAEQPPAAGPETPAALAKEPEVKAGGATKLTKLVITELVPGNGPAVKAGQTVTVNYKLVAYDTGEPLDSSWERGQPFVTPIGVGQVIEGWDKGMVGQKVGSRVQLDVPKAQAYPTRPEMGDLRFVVDILAAQ